MYHKISDMCDVVDVMHQKSQELRKMKYDEPKADEESINFLIADIQALALQIAKDKGTYPKTGDEVPNKDEISDNGC